MCSGLCRKHGGIPLVTYTQIYKGDIVDTKCSKKNDHMCFYGKTGSVYVTQQAMGFTVNKQVRGKVLAKRSTVHTGHVKNQDLSQVPETGEGKRREKRKPEEGHLCSTEASACSTQRSTLWGN